jgi:HSP20 family protein
MLFAPVATAYRRPALHSFERFLDEVMRAPAHPGQSIEQDDKAYRLRFDMPGISRAQLSVHIEDKVVRIQTTPDAPRHYQGSYELPQAIDAKSSTAKLEHGVLTLTLTKQVPVSRATTLNIE